MRAGLLAIVPLVSAFKIHPQQPCMCDGQIALLQKATACPCDQIPVQNIERYLEPPPEALPIPEPRGAYPVQNFRLYYLYIQIAISFSSRFDCFNNFNIVKTGRVDPTPDRIHSTPTGGPVASRRSWRVDEKSWRRFYEVVDVWDQHFCTIMGVGIDFHSFEIVFQNIWHGRFCYFPGIFFRMPYRYRRHYRKKKRKLLKWWRNLPRTRHMSNNLNVNIHATHGVLFMMIE